MKAYKGFDKNMQCRGFQYAEGETYELPEGQDAKLCERGFHACERPVDVLRYYMAGNAVFHEVEVDGVDTERGDNTKLSARKIHIGARLSIDQMVQATIKYNREHCTTEHTDPMQTSAGDGGAASAGDCGAAVSRGSASVGANGIACVRGNGCRIRGGLGAVLVIAEENDCDYDIASWRAVIVDGETIKADTWYKLVDGEFAEAADE